MDNAGSLTPHNKDSRLEWHDGGFTFENYFLAVVAEAISQLTSYLLLDHLVFPQPVRLTIAASFIWQFK
jgi:hypothetical protein